VASCYRASVVVAPAGAGKTSSLIAARQAWERAGKTVVGLAPTGKAADVMVREDVAHTSATIAKALVGTREMTPEQIALKLGWMPQQWWSLMKPAWSPPQTWSPYYRLRLLRMPGLCSSVTPTSTPRSRHALGCLRP